MKSKKVIQIISGGLMAIGTFMAYGCPIVAGMM